MKVITLTPETDLSTLAQRPLGAGQWFTIDQPLIDSFATITHDNQWLHTDPIRAAAGPYGTPIAHGFLLLALLPNLAASVMEFSGFSAVVNYGLDRVRFPAAARVGSRVRDRMAVTSIENTARGTLMSLTHEIQVADQDKPACVAQQLRLITP